MSSVKNEPEIRTVLFDFDGVLCKDRFYGGTFEREYLEVYTWIQENIFHDHLLMQDWMRGKIHEQEINQRISIKVGIDYGKLHDLFIENILQMKINERVADYIQSLKQSGCKVGLVTDNMDVFTQITV